MSVALHMMQTSADDSELYNYAIMESEPFGLPMRDTHTWGFVPKQFMNYTGCDPGLFINNNPGLLWECLRNRTMDEILDAQTRVANEAIVEADHFLQIFMPWYASLMLLHFPTCCYCEYNDYVGRQPWGQIYSRSNQYLHFKKVKLGIFHG